MNHKKLYTQARAVLRWTLCLSMVTLSSGCAWIFGDQGYFRERTLDYQKAQEINPLRFPEGVSAHNITELYPIPHVEKMGRFLPESGEDIPRPQSILSVDEDLGIELRSDGTLSWLIIEQEREKLWAILSDFLVASGMEVEKHDASLGRIETLWLKPRIIEEEGMWAWVADVFTGDDKENTREKFRITVEKEAEGERYRVQIDHVSRVRTDDGLSAVSQEEWDAASGNKELLDILYAELSDYIADEKNRRGHASIMAQNLTAMPSYLMTRDGNDYPVLMMQMDFNRAWIDVGLAIKKAELTQTDLNLSLGIYYIAVEVEDEEEPQIYEVKLISANNGVQVAVQIDDDTVAPVEISDKLLAAISAKLG
ncbi:MAG: hypothetical protein COA99_03500 [Moraxellaceae bacterium]|nr:MAG: hypothetical protein COA99_03500 [Moraxellaceae bacterium]